MRTITITDAVEAAARAQYERAAHPAAPCWEDCTELERAAYRIAVRPHVEAAAPFIAAPLKIHSRRKSGRESCSLRTACERVM